MSRPSLGLLSPSPPPFNMRSVLNNLAELVGHEFELFLAANKSFDESIINSSYNLFYGDFMPCDPYGVVNNVRLCDSFAKNCRPDMLMNVGKPFPSGIAVSIIGEKYEIPTALRVTGDIFNDVKLANNPLVRLRKWLVHEQIAARVYAAVDMAFCVGSWTRNNALKHGFSSDQTKVVPQPFNSSPFDNGLEEGEKRQLKRKLGLDNTRQTILYVGRLNWEKGSDRLLEAIRLVSRESDNFQFCIVGKGPYQSKFEEVGSCTQVAGPVPRQRIPNYYHASDLLIHPSRREGLPNVILEAIAARLPIVASPVGEIPHYVSYTCSSARKFAEYILQESWTVESYPNWFDINVQRNEYLSLFHELLDRKEGK